MTEGQRLAQAINVVREVAEAQAEALDGTIADATFILQAAVYAICQACGVTSLEQLAEAQAAVWSAVARSRRSDHTSAGGQA